MPYIQHHNHIPFILRPSSEIAKEAIWSLNASNGGIETYPISGYVLHSLFLKLTGAQEQKLKCICWEMACRDYEYRYERFERNRYSECSDLKDKNTVYGDLLDQIRKIDTSFALTDALRTDVLSTWRSTTRKLYANSLLAKSFKKQYDAYKTIESAVKIGWIMDNKQIFRNGSNISSTEKVETCGLSLNELFKDYVYKERNRCAHNTRSYQHNLPSLSAMMSAEYKLQNYFLFMSVILLLDTIYVKLFSLYIEKLSSSNY